LRELAAEPEIGRLRQPDFARFYMNSRGPVYRALALALQNRDLAAEAVDEAMTRAYERWRSVSTYESQEGWIFRVGLNWARNRLRKAKREVPTASLPETDRADSLPDPDVRSALGKLDVDARAVVVLRHYLDMTYDQMAVALDIPLGTAKSRLHHAMQELRGLMGVST
jgi:RNA polymerase sigma-70 factor (ECF subfamily)